MIPIIVQKKKCNVTRYVVNRSLVLILKVKVQDFLWGYKMYRVQYRSEAMSLIDEDSFSTPVGVP